MHIEQFISLSPVELLGLLMAFVAFFVPWRSAYKKTISVEWSDKIHKVPIGNLHIGNLKYLHPGNKYAYICSINIVNPSNVDIGYFDLAAIDMNKQVHMIMTNSTCAVNPNKEPLTLNYGNSVQHVLLMPEHVSGTLKANSYTHFDIVVTSNPNIILKNKIQIIFRVTYKSCSAWFHSIITTVMSRKITIFYHTFS